MYTENGQMPGDVAGEARAHGTGRLTPPKRERRAARFWIDWNGSPVRLTMRDGDRIDLHRRWPTDEGYSEEAAAYTHDGNSIGCDYFHAGRDCDGYLEGGAFTTCGLGALTARAPYDRSLIAQGIRWPEWKKPAAIWQRDPQAEAAGY